MTVNTASTVKTCRILYYGPEGVGKRENLHLIHASVPPDNRLALATGDPERQIAFNLTNSTQGSWQVLVQCVDAGRERYRSAGMGTQPPFDGIVFVVSSRAGLLDQAMAAMENLKTYLETWGLDLLSVPLVLQYNGRENPDTMPVDRLESLINPWGLLSFPGSTTRREGVKETLKAILSLTISHLQVRPRPPEEDLKSVLDLSEPEERETSPVEESRLEFTYGPAVPGTEIAQDTIRRSEAIFDELRPPIVIPIRIPRRLLEGTGPIKIELEIQVDDEAGF